ncbi:MAG: hypothetical protein L0210_10860 [Rhodospirillales bacterium]|nr:hypothetical protein [Rhodospirillales bacterium]
MTSDPLTPHAALARAKALKGQFAEACSRVTEAQLAEAEADGWLTYDDEVTAKLAYTKARRLRLQADMAALDAEYRQAIDHAHATYAGPLRTAAVKATVIAANKAREELRNAYGSDIRAAAARCRFAGDHQRREMTQVMKPYAKAVTVEGVAYPSVKAAHRVTGISKSTILDRIRAGKPGYAYVSHG